MSYKEIRLYTSLNDAESIIDYARMWETTSCDRYADYA